MSSPVTQFSDSKQCAERTSTDGFHACSRRRRLIERRRTAETLRRLRIGDLKRLFRARYGPVLSNDDAGFEDLRELLLPVSLAPDDASLKMKNTIETWAPWLGEEAAEALIGEINRTPLSCRMVSAEELGRRMQLTHHERERHRLWTIAAVDMTPAAAAEHRKFKKRMREVRRRRKKGIASREKFLASNATSRTKPWEAVGVSRATWYRRRSHETETGHRSSKTLNLGHGRVSHHEQDSRAFRNGLDKRVVGRAGQ